MAGDGEAFVMVAVVTCSICLEQVSDDGSKAIAKLRCGHTFHLSCIGCEFIARRMMRCPNCRVIEVSEWTNCASAFENVNVLHIGDQNGHHNGRNPHRGAMRDVGVQAQHVDGGANNGQNLAPHDEHDHPIVLGIPTEELVERDEDESDPIALQNHMIHMEIPEGSDEPNQNGFHALANGYVIHNMDGDQVAPDAPLSGDA